MKIEKLRFNYEEGIVQSTRISNKEKLNKYEKNIEQKYRGFYKTNHCYTKVVLLKDLLKEKFTEKVRI